LTSRQCSFGRKLSVRIRAIGIALLGIGVVVALVPFRTRLGQTLAAILVLIGGAADCGQQAHSSRRGRDRPIGVAGLADLRLNPS
jgi:hypothetical protein